MYLTNYDCYDLCRVILNIRIFPDNKSILPALEDIAEYINTPPKDNHVQDNIIRRILIKHFPNAENEWSWISVYNVYTWKEYILHNEKHYRILSAVLQELVTAVEDSNDRAYLLADCCHNVPEFLIDIKKPKKAVELSVRPYRKEYSENFLKSELRNL